MGYIRLDRALKNWRYKTKPNYVALWVECLLSANWEEKKWQDITVKKGEFITSYEHLAQNTGLSIHQVRNIISKLDGEELAYKSANKYSLIKIIKWEEYQCCEDTSDTITDNQVANKGQSKGKQRATTNNNNKYKEYKEYINIDNVELINALKEFEEMRVKKKKPLTDKARKMLVSKLKELSSDESTQIKILEQSVFKSWDSVYPLNNYQNKPKGLGIGEILNL